MNVGGVGACDGGYEQARPVFRGSKPGIVWPWCAMSLVGTGGERNGTNEQIAVNGSADIAIGTRWTRWDGLES